MKVIDLHCDTISTIYERKERVYRNTGHFDLERAVEAGIKIQFMALFVGPMESSIALERVKEQIDFYWNEVNSNQSILFPIRTAKEAGLQIDQNTIGSILHLEGAEAIGSDIEILHYLYESGLRSMGLTWNNGNLLAQGIGEGPEAAGLTAWGIKMVREMEKMGILLDGAHISERGFFDILEIYSKPLVVTHANARALCRHPRNLTDRQLAALGENGGIVGVNQVSDFVNDQDPDIDNLIDHIAYISELIGVKHVALGSDFDGADDIIMSGIEEYQEWPELLKRRGFNDEEINMILYKNALRTIKQVLI